MATRFVAIRNASAGFRAISETITAGGLGRSPTSAIAAANLRPAAPVIATGDRVVSIGALAIPTGNPVMVIGGSVIGFHCQIPGAWAGRLAAPTNAEARRDAGVIPDRP